VSTSSCARQVRPDGNWSVARGDSPAPISLVTSDGVELELLSVEAKTLLVEPLAFTELHLRFKNPEARQLEGRFRVVLPPSAAVARLAMKVGKNWEEAELVGLQQAREAYEMFLHRRQDPALLEHSAGNEFSVRVFPIAAKEEKELILGYSEELVQPDQPYRITLAGIRSKARVEVTVLEAGDQGVKERKLTLPAGRDFELPLKGGERLLRHGDLIVGRATAQGTKADAPIRSLAVLFDTSASRALGLQRQVKLLRGLLAEARVTRVDFPLSVLAFDQETVDVYDGPARDFGDAQERALLDRGALGASNLEQALQALERRLNTRPAERILVIGDGVTTAGALDGSSLGRLVEKLVGRHAKRLDAIVVGGLQDGGRLASLTVHGLPEGGVVLDGARSPAWLLSRLTQQSTGRVSLPTVDAAVSSWPRVLTGVLPGDSVIMASRLESADAQTRTLKLVDVDASFRPLLERAVARAEISDLEEQLDRTPATAWDDYDAIKTRLLQASTTARVLCRLTGFVVLENESAWRRTGLRVAPTKVLSLDSRGLHAAWHVSERGTCCEVPTPGPRDPQDFWEAEEAGPAREVDLAELSSARVTDDSSSAPMALRSLAKQERESYDDRPGSVVAKPKIEVPPIPSEPAAVSDVVQVSGLPELPKEPGDDSLLTPPALKTAGNPSQRIRRVLPKVPEYRQGDFDKLPKAYTGRFADVMDLLARAKTERARTLAEAWRKDEPGQTLALVALGEAYRAAGDVRRAARAFGSIIDLFPARADVRRFAAGRLASLHDEAALTLAIDSAWRAVEQRPDHPSGQHLLATFLLEAGRFEQALAVLTFALGRNFDTRYAQALRLLREDAALAAEALVKADPSRAAEMKRRLARLHAPSEAEASLRFVLTWESDANDVDFHVRDGLGYHAFYARKTLPTGGELYADIRDGYGPECFTIREPATPRAYPYSLAIRYASRGPMGYGMGTIQVIEHDGHGKLWFDHLPFVIMNDGGYLALPAVQRSH